MAEAIILKNRPNSQPSVIYFVTSKTPFASFNEHFTSQPIDKLRTTIMKKPSSTPRPRKQYEPTKFERAMFWSLIPATFLLPTWLLHGRSMIGGPKGWGSLFLIVTWAPVLFLYHLLLLAVTIVKNKRRQKKSISWKDYFVGEHSAVFLVLYYVVSVIIQIFMKDGDDQGSSESLASKWWGISERMNAQIGWLLFCMSLASGAELLFLAILEPLPGEPRFYLVNEQLQNKVQRKIKSSLGLQ